MASRVIRAVPSQPSPLPEQCDAKCPSAAMVAVVSGTSGLPLTFCGHHYADFETLLAVFGWRVAVDRRIGTTT